MNNETPEETRRKLADKPESKWTERDHDIMYWWYYHEMEDPTEEALRYCVKNYISINNVKWCAFLMEKFPSEENLNLVRRMTGLATVLKRMLRARPLSQNHIDLVRKYGSKKLCIKARKIETRLYEI